MRMNHATVAVMCAAAAPGLAACGDDDKDASASDTAKVAITATESGKRAKLTAPTSVPAGVVTVTLTNNGKFPHEAGLARIDAGHSVAEALKVLRSDEEGAPIPVWIHGAGGTGSVAPGGSASATQPLTAGTYVVTDSAATDQGLPLRAADAAFTVKGDATGDKLPATTASIEAFEYGFKTSGLKVGKNTVEFSNTGNELHHVIAAPFRPGATLAKVTSALKSNKASRRWTSSA